MQIPSEFDEIRPYTPEELPAVYEELLADEDFCSAIEKALNGVMTFEQFATIFRNCPDNLSVQKRLCYPFLKHIASKCATSLDLDASAIADRNASYSFITNHRDIVLDSAFLSIMLMEENFRTTVEIAIGDNLLIYPWIKKLVRVNKSFIVQRSLSMRQFLESSQRMSRYMHFAVREKHENLWIAQREGRAKDSNDRTQDSVLKMMAMGGEGTPAERLKEMHIVPMAISYEYDPCDILKAIEFQQKRDNPDFKKSRQDDLTNMSTGMFGFKGHIHYEAAPCADAWIDQYADLPKAQFFEAVARRIDKEMHARYRIYPVNCIALDLLDGNHQMAGHYTTDEKVAFEKYLNDKIAAATLPNKDEDYLRERMLTMYANPLRNYLKATAE